MILATSDDLDYPSVDWHCRECGEVYVSRGVPDDSRCLNGHDAGWRPHPDKMGEYVDLLESLKVGDGVLFAGFGPAALMGPVAEVGDRYIITESIDSPARRIRWDRPSEVDGESAQIEHTRMDREHEFYQQVYHVDTVEVKRRVE